MLQAFTIQVGQSTEMVVAASAHDAYDRWVLREFGNGTCGYDVEVICPGGTVVEF